MTELRNELTQYHRAESPSLEDTRAAIAVSRELIQTLEEESLVGLELALCLAEQARLFELLGDDESKERVNRQSLIVRRLCLGFDHPSCL